MIGMTEQDFYQRLSTSQAITAIVSDRVDNGDLPEGKELPAVTFMLVSDRPLNTHQGFTGNSHNRYSVSVWSNSYRQAKQLKQAVINTLSDQLFLGTLPLHERDKKLYRFTLDYSIFE